MFPLLFSIPKYHDSRNKPVKWLRRSYGRVIETRTLVPQIKRHNTAKDSTKLDTTPQGTEEGSSNFERNLITQSAYQAPITTPFGYTPPVQAQYL